MVTSSAIAEVAAFFAQQGGAPSADVFSGGVGNLVAAALQTKGLADQAQILKDFREVLEWIGALFWLYAICLAIGAVAVFGHYRRALYLLLGPPLFFFMITATVQTDGARLIVGDRDIGAIPAQNRLLSWIRAIGDEPGSETRDISFFFGVFDAIVTEFVQGVVAMLVDTENRDDLRFVARERLRSFILQGIPTASPLSELILRELFGSCGSAISQLQSKVATHNGGPVILRPQQDLQNAEQHVLETPIWTRPSHNLSVEVARYLLGMQELIAGYNDLLAGDGEQIDFPEVPFASPEERTPVSCEQIWGWVRGALFYFAAVLRDPETFFGFFGPPDDDVPWDLVAEDVDRWLQGAPPGGEPSNSNPTQVLAAFLFKNAASDATHSALQSSLFNRIPFNSKEYEGVFGYLNDAEAHGGFFKLRYFSTAVPYIQGLLLYLLAIAFPFFAIFLVLPGKAASFFIWCSLWVWVKSWDIGFALIFVFRDVLWHMMNNRVNVFETRIDWTYPSDVIQVAFSNDPLFAENIYWILVSGLTVIVPFLTAHFAMGATGMFQMFSYSIDQTAGRFGGVEANSARRHAANKIEHLQREHDFLMRKEWVKANADLPGAKTFPGEKNRNPYGAQTMAGFPISQLDWNKGLGFGDPKASSDAHGSFLNAAWTGGGFLLQNSTWDSRLLMASRIGKTLQMEAYNQKINEEKGRPVMPSHIPNLWRGFTSMHGSLTGESLKSYQQALEKYAGIVANYYGKNSWQYQRALADAQEVQGIIGSKKSLTWNQFFEREQQTQNYLQDVLALVTRRRMTALKNTHGINAIEQLINIRRDNATHSRNIFDGMHLAKVPTLGNLFMRPEAMGRPLPLYFFGAYEENPAPSPVPK